MKILTSLFVMFALVLAAESAGAEPGKGHCGRPVNQTSLLPKASDALYILRSAVGSSKCGLEDCDVNSDCQVSASDALGGLAASVGRQVDLRCVAECPTVVPCEENEAPVCNGVCPAGQGCVPADDEDNDERVTICHIPPGNPDAAQTLVVGRAAVAAHLDHGDYLGPCEGDEGPSPSTGDGEDDDPSASSREEGEDEPRDAFKHQEDPECVCVPLATTTTSSTTTTTLAGGTTTTLAGGTTTTTVSQPTTTLTGGTTTTTVDQPTTTQPEATTTTTAGEPTTTQPEATTTTTAGESTTTQPEATTTTTAGEPTTTQPEATTTTTAGEPTTTQPEATTTTTAGEPTTTQPEATTTTTAGEATTTTTVI